MTIRRAFATFVLVSSPMSGIVSQTQASVMAQVVPMITRASPTATRRTLTEGYLSQPAIMARASFGPWRAIGMVNLEGLTLDRGELTTGTYGEGYVDRRHPHAYVHELMLGVEGSRSGGSASLFAGRGFVPFGSDDPMVRPLIKYPVNHHLAQILERIVAVGAVRYGPVIGELGFFNGDEPLSPGSRPQFERFGDSWSARLTLMPSSSLELSASLAGVESPELPTGGGLDQRKTSLVGRQATSIGGAATYLMVEWAATTDRDRGRSVGTQRTGLAEAAVCRGAAMFAGRVEGTDRVEEEPLLDPFRVARPASDINSLGRSRWLTVSGSLTLAMWRAPVFSAIPFVEVAYVRVSPGDPAGVFDAEARYGSRTMWINTVGFRLRAGDRHDRMGRYGAATVSHGTMMHHDGSDMARMPHSSSSVCPL